jgi:probable HAF family extracellular repeat protein
MRRTRFTKPLFAAAALALPLLAWADPRYAVTVAAGAGGWANDLNNAGQVVGYLSSGDAYHGFVYTSGVLADIGTLGGRDSGVNAINDLGQVVGYLGVNSLPGDPGEPYPTTAFLYANGTMTVFGGTAPPWSSMAYDINNLGQVVGAFLYENGEMIELNTLIDPASGWTIAGAAAINDMQQIAATACQAGVCQAVRLDLVSAVPEPSMFGLLAAGLALGLARGRGGVRPPVRRRRG